MKPTLLATATIAAFALLVGCNGGGDAKTESGGSGGPTASGSGSGGDKRYTIAVIPKGATHEYWKSLHEGADQAAKELNVDIRWQGPLTEGDRENQIKIVEGFISTGVNGIVLAPLDDAALMAPVDEAAKQDIPTVLVDSPLKDDSKAVALVATNNEKGGATAATELAKLLNDKGTVMVLKYQEGSSSTAAREKGFFDEIAKHPGIKVLRQDYGGVTVDSAQKIAENMIQGVRQGDAAGVDGIYAVNESTTFSMLRALEDAKLAGKVKFVGFDASPKLIEGLKAGEVDGLIVQDPRKMGYLGVKTLVEKLKGEKIESTNVDTGVTYVTKVGLSDPKIAELVAPPKI